jgi:hypothetical protein
MVRRLERATATVVRRRRRRRRGRRRRRRRITAKEGRGERESRSPLPSWRRQGR